MSVEPWPRRPRPDPRTGKYPGWVCFLIIFGGGLALWGAIAAGVSLVP